MNGFRGNKWIAWISWISLFRQTLNVMTEARYVTQTWAGFEGQSRPRKAKAMPASRLYDSINNNEL